MGDPWNLGAARSSGSPSPSPEEAPGVRDPPVSTQDPPGQPGTQRDLLGPPRAPGSPDPPPDFPSGAPDEAQDPPPIPSSQGSRGPRPPQDPPGSPRDCPEPAEHPSDANGTPQNPAQNSPGPPPDPPGPPLDAPGAAPDDPKFSPQLRPPPPLTRSYGDALPRWRFRVRRSLSVSLPADFPGSVACLRQSRHTQDGGWTPPTAFPRGAGRGRHFRLFEWPWREAAAGGARRGRPRGVRGSLGVSGESWRSLGSGEVLGGVHGQHLGMRWSLGGVFGEAAWEGAGSGRGYWGGCIGVWGVLEGSRGNLGPGKFMEIGRAHV